MSHNRFLALLLFVAWSCAAQSPASTQTSIIYDNFNQRFLSPPKWNTFPACFTANGRELECVREIQDGRLRLAHRTFGRRDTDFGSQFGEAAFSFANPASIKSITIDLVIQNVQESSCAANPQYLGARAHIDARFFNTGLGGLNDDVGVQYVFGRSFSDPEGQISVFSQIFQGSNYLGFIPLGTFSVGTPVTATVTWDQLNHQFIASWTSRVTHIKTQTTMPYSFPDIAPATDPSKTLSVVTFAANCTAEADWVFIEANIDSVYIK